MATLNDRSCFADLYSFAAVYRIQHKDPARQAMVRPFMCDASLLHE